MDALRRDENLVELLEEIKSKYDHLIESREDDDHAQIFGKVVFQISFYIHVLIYLQGRTCICTLDAILQIISIH